MKFRIDLLNLLIKYANFNSVLCLFSVFAKPYSYQTAKLALSEFLSNHINKINTVQNITVTSDYKSQREI